MSILKDPGYVPFGPEWESHLMNLPKKAIIGLYRELCMEAQPSEHGVAEGYSSCFNLQIKPDFQICFKATNNPLELANGFYHARSKSMDHPMWGTIVMAIARAYDDHLKGNNPYTNGGKVPDKFVEIMKMDV